MLKTDFNISEELYSTTTYPYPKCQKRVRELYQRSDLDTHAILTISVDIVIPTATVLDDALGYLKLWKHVGQSNCIVVILGCVIERLRALRMVRTLSTIAELVRTNSHWRYFPNQFFRTDTRTVLDAVQWIYTNVNTIPSISVVSEHEEFLRLASEKNIRALSMKEYTTQLMAANMRDAILVDVCEQILSSFSESPKATRMSPSTLWEQSRIEHEIQIGNAWSGVLHVYPNRKKGFILHPSTNENVVVLRLNRAMHGDQVVVHRDGSVIGISRRAWRPYVVTMSHDDDVRLRDQQLDTQVALMCIPLEPRIPKIRVVTRQSKQLIGQRFVVAIDEWSPESKYPQGHVVRTIGPVADLATESSCILIESGLDSHLSSFSRAANECLPKPSWTVHDDNSSSSERRDLREHPYLVCSIDPLNCQDIDDALSFHMVSADVAQVGIHIADVSHFVTKDSPLDVEAARRATTVYLQDRRLDMLPRILSETICSLIPNVDRFAVSMLFDIPWPPTPLTQVQNVWLGRTIIRSVHALTYDQAQRLHDGDDPGSSSAEYPHSHTGKPVPRQLWEPLRMAIQGLQRVANWKRAMRNKDGALELHAGGELKFTMDTAHKPRRVEQPRHLAMHDCIAELMILANEYAARTLRETGNPNVILRTHGKPRTYMLERTMEILEGFGVKSNHATELAHDIVTAKATLPPEHFVLFCNELVRSMAEAEYITAGVASNSARHYGLGLALYTHFTSPIRRYSDIVVHRQLLDIGNCKSAVSNKEIHLVPNLTTHSEDDDLLYAMMHTTTAPTSNDDFLFEDMNALESLGGTNDAWLFEGETMESVEPVHAEETVSTNNNTNTGMSELCDHMNQQHRAAKEASWKSKMLFLSLYFKEHPQVMEAVVSQITEDGINCFVASLAISVTLSFEESHKVLYFDGAQVANLENAVFQLDKEGRHTGCFQNVSIDFSEEAIPNQTISLWDRIHIYICYIETGSVKPRDSPLHIALCKQDVSSTYSVPSIDKFKEGHIQSSTNGTPSSETLENDTESEGPSMYHLICHGNEKHVIRKKSTKTKEKPSAISLCRGRHRFGSFEPPIEIAEEALNDLELNAEDPSLSSQSFSRIQGDQNLVDKYVRNVTTEATRRMERLRAAKRDSRYKKALRGGK